MFCSYLREAARVVVLAGCIVAATGGVARAVDFEWDRGAGNDLWNGINAAGGNTNWSPESFPNATDNILLTGASLPGPVTIDLNGPRLVNQIAVNGVNGLYTFENTGAGSLGLSLNSGSALVNTSPLSTLVVDADIVFQSANTLRFNSSAGGRNAGRVIVNGGITTAAASGTTTLELTSNNISLGQMIQVHGVVSDGPTAVMAVNAGFAGDADQHRGEVVLTGLNTYTGKTVVNGATLVFNSIADVGGGASALGAPTTAANATIDLGINAAGGDAPGTLKYTGSGHSSNRVINLPSNTADGVIDASGTGPLVLSGGITNSLNGSKTVTFTGSNTGDNTVSGIIREVSGGNINVTKSGAGTWVFTGANEANGTTNVDEGELILRGAGSAISVGGGVSPLRINNAATFTLEGGTVNATEMHRSAAGTFNFKSGTVNLSFGTSTFVANGDPLVIGSNGSGTLNLQGTSAEINDGVVIHGSNDTLNVIVGSLTTTSLDNTKGGTFNFTGGAITINGGQITTGAGAFRGRVSGTGGVTKIGPGTLTLHETNIYTGPTNINQGVLALSPGGLDHFSSETVVNIAAGATLDLVGSNGEALGGLAGAGRVITSAGADIVPGQNNQNSFFSGVISGTGNLGKTGNGTLTLTGNHTYSGGLTTVTGGTIKLGAGNTLPDQTRVTLSVPDATLDLNNSHEQIGGLSGVAGSFVHLGNGTLTTGSNNETLNFDGSITGSGGLTKIGTGVQRLRAFNSFTGDIKINAGTLEIGINDTIGNNAVTVEAGATLRVVGDGESFGSLAGAGSVVSEGNITVGVNPGFNNTSTVFSGDITGIGPLIKSGTGTMTMTGTSGYTGFTRADNGVLVFSGASSGLTATNRLLLDGGDMTLRNNTSVVTTGNIDLQTTSSDLLIESGAKAHANGEARIGDPAGSDARVTVTGVGSRLSTNGRVRVGNFGKGTLNVLAGGQVATSELVVADEAAGATDSTAIIDGFINNGSDGVFGTDDDRVSNITVTGVVTVGEAARGTLAIRNGGRLISGTGSSNHSANSVLIGSVNATNGTKAIVTGEKSMWVNHGWVTVANQAGDAANPIELNVLDGGYAQFSFLQSSVLDGSRSKVTVDGAGSVLKLRDGRGDAGVISPGFGSIRMVPVGSNGRSDIFVTGGGVLDIDTNFEIGSGTGDTAGQANVTVGGAGSTLNVGKELSVTFAGTPGSLTVINGGTVNSGISNAADPNNFTRGSFISRSNGNGTVNVGAVAGADAGHKEAAWNVATNLYIAGTAAASNNGTGTGVLNINPTGRVSVAGQLRVWDQGTVNLNGGTLEVSSIDVSDSPTVSGSPQFNFNSGTVRFTTPTGVTLNATLLNQLLGANPTLTAGKGLAVANTASLVTPLRTNGGTFSVGQMDAASVANLDFDAGTLNLTQSNLVVGGAGAFGSTLIIAPDQTINVTQNATVAADGRLVVAGGFSSASLTNNHELIAIDTTIGGPVNTPGGTTVTVIGQVGFNGMVRGGGQFFGAGESNFMVGHRPGDSTATIGFSGSVVYPQTSTLFIEIGGTTPGDGHDRIDIAQSVTLGGGTLDITRLNGYVPNYMDEFVVITAGTRIGKFDDINGAAVHGNMTLAPVYDYEDNVGLTLVAAIPGDANLDGIVNGLDLLRWQANLFSGDEWSQGDFNLDGTVSGLDLLIWQSHLFDSVQSLGNGALAANTATVPEPGALVLMGLIALGICTRRGAV